MEEVNTSTKKTLTFRSAKEFVLQTRELLRQEQDYQIELFNQITNQKTMAEIEAAGYGLSNMLIISSKRGYYGKTVLSLTKAYHSEKNPQLLPEDCKIQVGDDVALYKNNSIIADGVVSKRMGPKLQVSTRKQLEDDQDLQGVNCNVILKWNEVTFNRYFRVLDDIEKSQSPLLPIFFPPATSPPVARATHSSQHSLPSAKLNQQQQEAVEQSLREQIFLLHGPPGTGKTTTVCEIIVEGVKKGWKILACGPSNIAVDNIVEGVAGRVECTRIGNPARIIDSVLERCLDYQIASRSYSWKNEVKKLQALRKRLGKGGTKQQRRAVKSQMKQLKQEVYRLQEQVIEEILADSRVLCCTNVGAADRIFHRYLPKQMFDLVVIDECGQALEVSCWIPLLKAKRVLLAGDHKQLPPTIQGNETSLLSYTLFSRSMEELHHIPSTMLRVQYRMNTAIMGWSNQQFYEGKLKAHHSVESHTLQQLCLGVKPQQESLLFIDTAGCGMGEEGAQNESKMNVGEADLVVSVYRKLIGYGVQSKYIAVLTPYSKQVALIKSLIAQRGLPGVDVSTVDGIQGREKQCIILSMVRSNTKRDIGFLRDWRRMNVAVTRARRMLVLIGNIECVSKDKHIKALVQWVQNHGHISSAQEFRGEEDIRFGVGVSDKIDHYEKQDKTKEAQKQDKINKKKKKKQKQKEGEEDKKGREHTEEEQAAVRDHFRKVFEQMGREITINNATAFERKMIHEAAESLGLCHETAPDKKWIKVWKKMTNDEVAEHYAQLERIKMEEDLLEQAKKTKRKNKVKKTIPNAITHKNNNNNKFDHLKEMTQQDSSQPEQDLVKEEAPEAPHEKEEERVQKPKNNKKRKNNNKKEPQPQQEEDIEALMRQFNADRPKEDQCYKCNRKLSSVTAATCKYCSVNFCRQHVLAEEHGCGEAAKAEARRTKPTDKQLQEAARKLKEKIREQEEGRKKKVKDKEGKK